jgi:hypothetical protein
MQRLQQLVVVRLVERVQQPLSALPLLVVAVAPACWVR